MRSKRRSPRKRLSHAAQHLLQWSDKLPIDFYRQPSSQMESSGTMLRVAESFDLAIRTSLSSLLASFSLPVGYRSQDLKRELELARSDNQSALENINQYRPLKGKIDVKPVSAPFGMRGGTFEKLSWKSGYANKTSNITDYAQGQRNKRAVALHWRHGDKPRPTIIFLHGFIASSWHINDWFMGVRRHFEEGYDVILNTLPHHGLRAATSWLSGVDYVSGGIRHLNHSVVQSTFDIRRLVDYLVEEADIPKVGLCGMSLGGYTAALMAGIEKRLHFVVPMIPIVSIPDAMMVWRPLDKALKKIMREHQLEMPELRESMAFHSPLSFAPQIDREKLMIIAGIGDRMAPPRHAEQLQDHWQDCDIHWFKGSHVLPIGREKIHLAKQQFFERINF